MGARAWWFVVLAGCGSTSFEGTVVDHTGKPIPGALVTVVGQLCQVEADEAGAFAVACNSAKGDTTLSAGASGHVSAEVEVEVSERQTYDVGTLELVGIPEGEGLLWLREAGVYSEPQPGHIVKDVVESRDGAVASFCLAEDTPTNALAGSELTLFDKGHEGWRLWTVGEDGCVYKKRRVERGVWERTFGDKLTASQHDLGGQYTLAMIELEPGRYWLGEWERGFFAPDSSVDGPVHYKGYLLQVP